MTSTTATLTLTPPLCTPGYDVTGRCFVVTGGTQGLGLGIARSLKKQGATALVVVSRNATKGQQVCHELTSDTCQCHFVQADLGEPEQAQSVIPRAVELLATSATTMISGVVNAAAITERGNLQTTTVEGFDLQFAINVRAPFLITQAAAKHMMDNKIRGSIVNISSVASHGGAPFIMAYSASKAALNNLTQNNAAELAPQGIRVNAINMGWTVTENENQLQSKAMGDNWTQQADASVPLGRILRPEDVAATVGFLLSDSSAMMTGNIMNLHPEFPLGMLSLLDDEKKGR
ncbi:5-keto-D-gluconate 5-reductase [Seminavis robusta]|uniref:5-keto-D-gluconate 5-reductase n=1 Tax=Seminavis robusta TaxID=568900 RepID=A0A9N8DAC5_9STRA|nr:5-keto-D-gluconate 5-reductase [Seminavis robusta]|eukprot:Sro1_g000330.1 5-keto-D-gluconate 5-reductase (290) ;mRNA; f:95725-96594